MPPAIKPAGAHLRPTFGRIVLSWASANAGTIKKRPRSFFIVLATTFQEKKPDQPGCKLKHIEATGKQKDCLNNPSITIPAQCLQVNRFPISYFNSIFDAFADGWMRMNAVQYLMIGCFKF